MGAGSYPCGVGRAGFDPPRAVGRLTPILPLAAFFDPSTRDMPLTAAGDIQSVHPVDQKVSLALGISVGGASPSPGLGLDIARVRRASRIQMQAILDDIVRNALEEVLTAGDVELVGVTILIQTAGRTAFEVAYRNLRLPSASNRRARVSL